MNKFYITTAIDYVNDVIHVGHAFQKIAADILARYYRIKLGSENVFFLTGTDEYGQNIVKTAEKNGKSPKEWADKIAIEDQKQQEILKISFNRFIRTTDYDHAKVAQEIWKRVYDNGDIYLGEYTGLYCPNCEAFYTENDLIENRCPFHPTIEVQKITEKNFFFKWSKYQDFLINLLEGSKDFVSPDKRRREMLLFAKLEIRDIPISRTSFKWGVPVPNQPDHVMYVWFDALTNYLTGVGFLDDPEKFQKFWPADIHILGKDNARWHALLWPAILKSAGLELPKQILVNGFLSLNGQKISKSLGNIIRPSDWVEKYSADAVRYYLLRYTSLTEDSDISEEKLKTAYNADLANGLGNLVSRIAKLCEQNGITTSNTPNKFDPLVEESLEQFRLNEALIHIWNSITYEDQKINETQPWRLEGEELRRILEDLVNLIQTIAFNLQPFLPETSEKILTQFSGSIKSAAPLFPRI